MVAILLFLARLPAMARVPIIGKNLAKSITSPNDTFKNIVFPLKPAKAEPLLPPHDEYAYNISENPCAPELFKLSATPGTIAAIPLPNRMATGVAKQTTTDHFISYGSIFLPKNSGVRPTIRPAINTVSIAKASIPYSPQPTPPNITSPNCISNIVTIPPRGV